MATVAASFFASFAGSLGDLLPARKNCYRLTDALTGT